MTKTKVGKDALICILSELKRTGGLKPDDIKSFGINENILWVGPGTDNEGTAIGDIMAYVMDCKRDSRVVFQEGMYKLTPQGETSLKSLQELQRSSKQSKESL